MLSEGHAPKNFRDFLSTLYQLIDRLTLGNLSIFRFALQRFIEERGAEAAASVAFFTIFSFFPLLLVLIGIGSLILRTQQIQNQIIQLVRLTFPNPELVVNNLQAVLEEQQAVGVLGLIALAWSATGALTILSRTINRAWPASKQRNFIESRVIALVMIAALMGLLTLSTITATVLRVLSQFSEPLFGTDISGAVPLFNFLTNLIPFIIGLLIFLGLYRWVPNTEVPWKAAFRAAFFAALVWAIFTNLFSYYLSIGLEQYQLIYGGLGATVAFMLWIYLNYLIVIFGAHLAAAIAHYGKVKQ